MRNAFKTLFMNLKFRPFGMRIPWLRAQRRPPGNPVEYTIYICEYTARSGERANREDHKSRQTSRRSLEKRTSLTSAAIDLATISVGNHRSLFQDGNGRPRGYLKRHSSLLILGNIEYLRTAYDANKRVNFCRSPRFFTRNDEKMRRSAQLFAKEGPCFSKEAKKQVGCRC